MVLNGLSADWAEFQTTRGTDHVQLEYLEGVNRINLLVGPNSSRKSRFCRRLFHSTDLILSDQPIAVIARQVAAHFMALNESFRLNGSVVSLAPQTSMDPANFDVNKYPILQSAKNYATHLVQKEVGIDNRALKNIGDRLNAWQTGYDDLTKLFSDVQEIVIALELALDFDKVQSSDFNIRHFFRLHLEDKKGANAVMRDRDILILPLIKAGKELLQVRRSLASLKYLYIPTLRGALSIKTGDSSTKQYIGDQSYTQTVLDVYKLEALKTLTTFTGLDLYNRILELRNIDRKSRKGFVAFEAFLSARFFNGQGVELIADYKRRTILINLGNDDERELHDVGDGIQSLIILLFPIFTCEDKLWVVAEEPEVHLHPGFQTLFLETLLTDKYLRAKELTYFITTHSNHLLDYSLTKSGAVSMYTFTPENRDGHKYSIVKRVNGTDISMLDLLGVANSSVFLSQCSVWVEGISDRMILRAYLNAYLRYKNNEFIEDLHYSFIEYGGSNIRHYSMDSHSAPHQDRRMKAFVHANRIWMLSDLDSGKEKRDFHRSMKELERPGFFYQTTVAREIENTLPVEVLRQVLLRRTPVSVVAKAFESYNPVQNKQRKMGEIFNQIASMNGAKKHRVKYADEYNGLTSYYKLELAKELTNAVDAGDLQWQAISKNPYAKRVTESLYSFLKRNVVKQ